MARKSRPGLDYFPFDVDFFEDDKVQLIDSEFGSKGVVIMVRLMCRIFRNGYYCQWGQDESLLFAKRVGDGVTGALVDEVVKGLIRRLFFDKGVFDRFAILTSKGIQTRYIDAKERAKNVQFFKEYALIEDNVLFKWNNVVINSINGHINTQIKGEEIKGEERREEETPAPENSAVGELYWDIETILTNDQKTFEACCMAAGKNAETGKLALQKFHLHYQEKEFYPKSKKALIAGFKKWLLGEKTVTNGTIRKNTEDKRTAAPDGYNGL